MTDELPTVLRANEAERLTERLNRIYSDLLVESVGDSSRVMDVGCFIGVYTWRFKDLGKDVV
jgi:hypothetical protein